MLSCLIDYIGIKQGVSAPESGIYINSLAGISTEIVQKVADIEQQTFNSVWADVQEIACRRLYSDLISKMKAKYVASPKRGYFVYEPLVGADEAAENKKKGLLMDFGYSHITMQSFFVGYVHFATRNIGTTTLYIQDENGFVLMEREVQYEAGLNSYLIGKKFAAEKLFIGFSMDGVDGYEGNISTQKQGEFSHAVYHVCNTSSATIEGSTFDAMYVSDGANTHGVGITGYAGCDYSAYVCYNKELFTSAWLFLLGNQLMIEVLGSNRITAVTTVDRPMYEQLRDIYQSDYEKQLASLIDGIVFGRNDCCIECIDNPKVVTWLP